MWSSTVSISCYFNSNIIETNELIFKMILISITSVVCRYHVIRSETRSLHVLGMFACVFVCLCADGTE